MFAISYAVMESSLVRHARRIVKLPSSLDRQSGEYFKIRCALLIPAAALASALIAFILHQFRRPFCQKRDARARLRALN
jgi:hypothetical protein